MNFNVYLLKSHTRYLIDDLHNSIKDNDLCGAISRCIRVKGQGRQCLFYIGLSPLTIHSSSRRIDVAHIDKGYANPYVKRGGGGGGEKTS